MNTLAYRIAAVFVLLAAAVAAQTNSSNWSTVKALSAGTDVRILNGSRTVSGKIAGVTDEMIVVNLRRGEETFKQPEVMRVSLKKPGPRVRNALIGLGVGTGAGLGIGAANEAGCQGWFCGLDTAAGGVIGALGGTVAGAVWPTGGWRAIYQK